MGCDGIRTSAFFGAVAAAFLGGFMAGPPKAVAQEGQLSDLYNECSPAYAGFRRQVYESLLEQARRHQSRAAAAQAGQRFDEMLAEFAQAMGYLQRVGMLPPASLPKPCPPPSGPPPYTIPGTEIRVFDDELAAKWGRRLAELRRNTCSNRHLPLLQHAKDGAAADRSARERAAGEATDPESKARHLSDAEALEQLESVLPEEPCSGRPVAPADVAGTDPESAPWVMTEAAQRWLTEEWSATVGSAFTDLPRWRLNEQWSFNLGVHYEDGFNVKNGGFGGTQSATGGRFEIGHSFEFGSIEGETGVDTGRRTFSIFFSLDALRADANIGATGTTAAGRTFAQPTGGPGQFVPGAAAHTGGKMEVDLLRIGARIEIEAFPQPFSSGVPFSPRLGPTWDNPLRYKPYWLFGYEYGRLDTKLTNEWAGINFIIVDSREARNHRFMLGGGIDFGFPLTQDVSLFGSGSVWLNFDHSRGQGSYRTAQTGNFDITVNGFASGLGVTPAGGLELGIKRRFPNGTEGSLIGGIELESFPQVEYRIGAPPRLVRDYQRKFKFSVGFRF